MTDLRSNQDRSRGRRDAARVVRNVVLLGQDLEGFQEGDPGQEAWFAGPDTCAEVLRERTGGELKAGVAFGKAWPWVDADGVLLSPGLSVPLAEESQGPDGVYRREKHGVLREAGGREHLVLSTHQASTFPGRGFDVLWFEEAARCVVGDGVMEVDDLFSRLIVPVGPAVIEKKLVRVRRCDPAILGHIPGHERPMRAAMMDVARSVAVTSPEWRDPEAFFLQGVGFEKVRLTGGCLRCSGADAAAIEFRIEADQQGWRAVLCDGRFPFLQLAVRQEREDVVLVGSISDAIDPLSPGMRERLAFDLRSLLISLGEPAAT